MFPETLLDHGQKSISMPSAKIRLKNWLPTSLFELLAGTDVEKGGYKLNLERDEIGLIQVKSDDSYKVVKQLADAE